MLLRIFSPSGRSDLPQKDNYRRTPSSASAKRETQREYPALKAGSLVTGAITFGRDRTSLPHDNIQPWEAGRSSSSVDKWNKNKAIGMGSQ